MNNNPKKTENPNLNDFVKNIPGIQMCDAEPVGGCGIDKNGNLVPQPQPKNK